MDKNLRELLQNEKMIIKIQSKLPYLFQLAEQENVRAGKIGMEIGIARERIITSLLIYRFGIENVSTDIPATEPIVDVKLFDNPISIKTITGSTLRGVKLIWTVDQQKAAEFKDKYYPSCDMLIVQINWNYSGGLFYFPVEAQKDVFKKLGRDRYIILPKEGTNPRGAEISADALSIIRDHQDSVTIPILWNREELTSNQYTRWVDLWAQE